MFFRMLWHDLCEKKGMNVILFLFITVASILVFVSAAEIYSSATGSARTKEACRITDGVLVQSRIGASREKNRALISEALEQDEEVQSFVIQEHIPLTTAGIDFDNFEEAESETFMGKSLYLMQQSTDVHMVYTVDDEPFVLQNGQIAVPQNIRLITGSKIGDKLRLTTDLGNIYEFEIACFYKNTERWTRFYISAGDYEALTEEFPLRNDLYQVCIGKVSYRAMADLAQRMMEKTQLYILATSYEADTSDSVFSSIVALFMTAVSVFMILLIFMTIRFTMIAALKDEEKGIGMMRAIGVDSVKFRWLFAAKFIAFAVVGGIIGIAAGFPLSKRVILEFTSNMLSPSDSMLLLIGACAVLAIIALMVLFSLSVMRRMKRISIMDAIRCENRGERFRKLSRFSLDGRKKMGIPLFLALSDLFTRLKRYLFLIFSYTLGAAIILLIVSLRQSIVNPNYLHYDMISNVDFYLRLSKTQMKPYNDRSKYEDVPFWYQINEELEEAGIPAGAVFYNSDWMDLEYADMQVGEAIVVYDLPDESIVKIREGSMPQKADECALSYHTAEEWGIGIGSELKLLSMSSYVDENGETVRFTQNVTVTALFDLMEQGNPRLVMSKEYEPESRPEYMTNWCALNIYSDDKEAVLTQLRERFGEEHVKDTEQYMLYYLGEFETILTTMMYGVTAVVIIVLALITVLYVNIFLGEDKPEIALLKSLGFSNGAIYASQLLRMLILAVVSILAAIILTKTAGIAVARMLIGIYVGLTGFEFEPMMLFTAVILPLLMLAAVMIPTLIRLGSIKNVDIRDISEE